MRKIFIAFLALPLFACQSHQAPANAAPSSADARADALIKQMTLEEKISLLGGDTDHFSTHAVARLGVPKLVMADGPQGIRNYPPSCSFPCGAALAATWDTQLAAAYGKAMGLEARARGVNFILGPGMNICRVPVNGRNFEYLGEDPFLAGKIAANWVRAAQAQGVITTVKHYAANNQEWNRESVDEQINARTLQEIYLPAFRRAVQEGGAHAVMAAYNRVNGAYCAENDVLLNQILKKQWNFQGIVMSDWGVPRHGIAGSRPGPGNGRSGLLHGTEGQGGACRGIDQGIRHRQRRAPNSPHGHRDGIFRSSAKTGGLAAGIP